MVEPSTCPPKTEIELADVVRRFAGKYTTQYGLAMMPSQKRDKAFRIAEPMRKASWTKCFAAGGRNVGRQIGAESGEWSVKAKGRRD